MSEATKPAIQATKAANTGTTADRRFSVAPMMDRVDREIKANQLNHLTCRSVLL
jgi:hypothetical protein